MIISHRHIETYFELFQDEATELWVTIFKAKEIYKSREVREFYQRPTGEVGASWYLTIVINQVTGHNIGINNEASAGQTVMHLHIHWIPHFDGDVPDPIGGVRFVVPAQGNYRDK